MSFISNLFTPKRALITSATLAGVGFLTDNSYFKIAAAAAAVTAIALKFIQSSSVSQSPPEPVVAQPVSSAASTTKLIANKEKAAPKPPSQSNTTAAASSAILPISTQKKTTARISATIDIMHKSVELITDKTLHTKFNEERNGLNLIINGPTANALTKLNNAIEAINKYESELPKELIFVIPSVIVRKEAAPLVNKCDKLQLTVR